ncbi:MAG: class I SAM-dependent methyltransferase [Candidatus Zixiibacteriota bacterium]
MLKDYQDAYGHQVYDYLNGKGSYEIVERDDGFIDVSGGAKNYLAEYKDWPLHQRQAIRYARRRVLDIGSGPGRVLLYLQHKGFDVMGIDISPLAVEVCKRRGIQNVKTLSITQVSSKLGIFDTIVMYGNNFGLFGSRNRARRLLKRFHKITSEKARIIAETLDPYRTSVPEHLQYHKFNRKRGRMCGQVRIRVRYKKYVTPWFDYLFVSEKEMTDILKGTGWQITRIFSSRKSPAYVAVIEKTK